MARPTKLTAETAEKIVTSIAAGNYAETACRSAGVSASTYYRWLERGEEEDSGAHRDFFEAVGDAEAAAEINAVATIQAAMPDDWRAAMAYLERRYGERWQRRPHAEKPDARTVPVSAVSIRIATSVDEEGVTTERVEYVDDEDATLDDVDRRVATTA